ncbi:ABC transporter substrate-binding protein [Paraburkholderia rhynchosiae]|nr:ABC transporter substrate-binding protein [Paraburkholderia rhynchosiae]
MKKFARRLTSGWPLTKSCSDITVALFLSLCVVQPVVAQTDAVRTLTIAEYRPDLSSDQPTMRGMKKFAELVNAQSDGHLAVRVSGNTIPGLPDVQIKRLQAGGAGVPDLMLLVTPALRNVDRNFELMDLPFIVHSNREADALLDGPFGQTLMSRLHGHGLTGLAWWENGFRQITTSGQPFIHALDLTNRTVRVIPTEAFVDTFKALRANVVGLPYPELYDALKSKRVNAEDNFYSQILVGHLYDVQSAVSVTNHSYSAIALVANSALWKSLTVRDRNALQHAAVEAGRYERDLIREQAIADCAELVRHGMTVYHVSPEELAKMEALTDPIRKRFFVNYDRGILDIYQRETAKLSTAR